MKLVSRILIASTLALFLATHAAAAPDDACTPLLESSEARAAAATSQAETVVVSSNFTMKFVKMAGKSYSQLQGGPWKLMPVDISAAERQLIAQINSGEVKVSDCRAAADETINGSSMKVLHYTVEMPGAPAETAKLYIGASDGLPYLQTSPKTRTTYSYTGIQEPEL